MHRPPPKPDKKKKTLKPFGVFKPVKPTIKPERDPHTHEEKLMLFNKPEFKDELKAVLEHKKIRDKLDHAMERDTEHNLKTRKPFRIQSEDLMPKEYWIGGAAPAPFSSRTKLQQETVTAIAEEDKALNNIREKYQAILQNETKDPINVSVIGAGPGGLIALAFMLKSGVPIKATVYEQRDVFSRLSQLIAYPGLRLSAVIDKQAFDELISHGGTYHVGGDEGSEYETADGFCAPTAVWQKVLKHMLERNGVTFVHAKKTPAELAGEADIVVSARGAHSPDAVSNPRGRHSYGRQIGYIMQSFYPADSELLKSVKTDESPWETQEEGDPGCGFTITTHNTVSQSFARRRDIRFVIVDDATEIKEWEEGTPRPPRPPWEHQHPEEAISWNYITKSELIEILDIQINRLGRKRRSSSLDDHSIIDAEINRIQDLKKSLQLGQKIIFSECGVIMRRGGEHDERIFNVFHPDFVTLADRFVKHPRLLANPVDYEALQATGTKIKTEVARLGDEIATPHWATGRGFYGPVCESEYLQPFISTLEEAKKLERAADNTSLPERERQALLEDAEKMRLHARHKYGYAVSDIANQIVLVGTIMDLLPFYNEKSPDIELKHEAHSTIKHDKKHG